MSTSWDQEMDQEIGMEFDHGAKELSDMPPAQFYLWKEDTCIPPALEQNSNDKSHGATNMEFDHGAKELSDMPPAQEQNWIDKFSVLEFDDEYSDMPPDLETDSDEDSDVESPINFPIMPMMPYLSDAGAFDVIGNIMWCCQVKEETPEGKKRNISLV